MIYYWTGARSHGIYLFYIIKKKLLQIKLFSFQNLSAKCESRLLPTLANTKKAIPRNLLSIQNEAISLVSMRSKELWLVQENHAIVKAAVKADSKRHSSCNEKLQRKQNSATKSTNLIEDAGKVKSVFVIRVALTTKKLGRSLEYCRSWKYTLGNLVVAMNTRGHLIGVLNERSVSDGGTFCLPSVVGNFQISLI